MTDRRDPPAQLRESIRGWNSYLAASATVFLLLVV
jgi:hypothetical protein